MTKISQDEAERKCANLRLESLHRHNDHEVFLITVIVTPLSKFYLFICCHFHCHRYRNHQGHRQSYLHCHRGQVLLGKLQAVVESHSKCLKNSEKVGDVTSFGKQPTSCSAHHIVHETTTVNIVTIKLSIITTKEATEWTIDIVHLCCRYLKTTKTQSTISPRLRTRSLRLLRSSVGRYAPI